jgi:hypothetical protein
MMTHWQFETALRTLNTLDLQELVDAGVIAEGDYGTWDDFHADRVAWYLAHPAMAEYVWRAIWRHMSPGQKAETTRTQNNIVDLEHVRSGKR